MKLFLLFFVFSLSVSNIFAQTENPVIFPRNDEGKVLFTDVVQVDSTLDKSTLYGNAKLFFANTFKSAQDVIQVDDKENGRIVGKGFSEITLVALYPYQAKMYYTISVSCKDGRYKYEIYDIYYQNYPSAEYPNPYKTDAEFVFSEKQYYNGKGKARKVNERHKKETEEKINILIENLKKEMQSGVTNNDSKW